MLDDYEGFFWFGYGDGETFGYGDGDGGIWDMYQYVDSDSYECDENGWGFGSGDVYGGGRGEYLGDRDCYHIGDI